MLNILNPNKQLQRMLKKRIPVLKKDLFKMLEEIFLQVADQSEENPFELVMILSKKDKKVLARVFDNKKQELAQTDAGAIMREMVMQQLSALPDFAKEIIEEELQGEDIDQLLVDAFEGQSLVIHYGEKEQLIFVLVNKNGSKNIDLDEFLNTLEF